MKRYLSIVLVVVLLIPSNAWAVGSGAFENASFSGRSLAEGNAVVAQPDEPAAISYNPAGIADLKGVQIQANTGFVSILTEMNHGGDKSDSAGNINVVPTAYATVNPGKILPGKILDDRLALGVGMDSPFGLKTDYDSNFSAVHYTGYANAIRMYAIKPVVAIKLHEKLSVGAGPMYYRIFDFTGVQAYPNTIVVPGAADGQVRVHTKGHGWGWHLGVLAKPSPKHQLGFYMRSGVTVGTSGLVKVERSLLRGNFETGANAKFDLPLNFTWAYAFKPTPKDAIEVDLGYTRWKSFKRLYINADTIVNPTSVNDDAILAAIGRVDKDFNNSFSLHLGGHHKFSEKFTARGGWFFYWTPIPKHSFIPAIPDSNSMAFTLGTSHKIMKWLTLDWAYMARIYFPHDVDNGISETLGTTVDGKYTSFCQELMLSMTYKLDEIFGKSQPKEKEEDKEDVMAKEILGIQQNGK